jgi:pimeloyl-ACP methyl ester carboxylesterase
MYLPRLAGIPVLFAALLLVLGAASAQAASRMTGDLPRRADLGFVPVADRDAIKVSRLVNGSPADRAGVEDGDLILRVAGTPIGKPVVGVDQLKRANGGRKLVLQVERNGESKTLAFTPQPLPMEDVDGLESLYGVVEIADGTRLRSIITRPTGAQGPLPAIFFTQWVSCGSIEFVHGGLARELLEQLALKSGATLIRVERAGTGDSEGPGCHELDYDTELAHYREAFTKLVSNNPLIDSSRVVIYGSSLGSTVAPLVAEGNDVAGIMVQGGGAVTYLERMINFDRQNLERTGVPPQEIHARMLRQIQFNVEYLAKGRNPEEIARDSPEMAAARTGILGMEDGTHYGRPYAWHQQAAQQNFLAAWLAADAPVLVIYGEFDQWEGRHGHELIADTINRQRSGTATFLPIPHMDHDGDVYDTIEDAYAWRNQISGDPDRAHFLQTGPMLRWLDEVAFKKRGGPGRT